MDFTGRKFYYFVVFSKMTRSQIAQTSTIWRTKKEIKRMKDIQLLQKEISEENGAMVDIISWKLLED